MTFLIQFQMVRQKNWKKIPQPLWRLPYKEKSDPKRGTLAEYQLMKKLVAITLRKKLIFRTSQTNLQKRFQLDHPSAFPDAAGRE